MEHPVGRGSVDLIGGGALVAVGLYASGGVDIAQRFPEGDVLEGIETVAVVGDEGVVVIVDHLVDAAEVLGHIDGAVGRAGVVVEAVGGSRGVGERPVRQQLLRHGTQAVGGDDVAGERCS